MENDAVVMQVAGLRGGVCTRVDLRAAGLSAKVIDRRIAGGLLRPVGRGVYIIDALVDDRTALHRAVLLVPQGVLSDSTAGHIHQFPLEPATADDPVHLAVPPSLNRRVDGIVLHRRCPLADDDVIVAAGLRMTGLARTIVDLSATLGYSRLLHVVQTQVRDDRPSLGELVACFHAVARRGVTGVAKLRRVLEPMVCSGPIAQSALEEATARLLNDHRIPGFIAQYRPPWYDGWRGIVDFAHPESRVVLEADGRRWHGREQEMTADRRRDRMAAAHGWLTIRVTWEEVTQRPSATADEIRRVLDARLVSKPAA